ncbi:MAG: hypothetical protein J7L66_00350 [Anaerolineaceae bacterium]|nr:hypothetical protein [Anaerolineaceae bacterium]
MGVKSSNKKIKENRKLKKRPIQEISGVYFGKNRFLRVVDQPSNNPAFVSNISNTATNFQMASKYGNIGLIAHNYLGGRFFEDLKIGDDIHVMDGFGHTKIYRVKEIIRYHAVNPRSIRSNFIDLKNNRLYSANDVFKRVYKGSHHLVLQTCIKRGKNEEWGRKFIIAYPK